MFDKYQKAARAGPDKKEREEIETLKLQVRLCAGNMETFTQALCFYA